MSKNRNCFPGEDAYLERCLPSPFKKANKPEQCKTAYRQMIRNHRHK